MADSAKVYLVGADTGDPDLLTRKVEMVLHGAAAVIYDRRVSPGVLALASPDAKFMAVNAGSQEEIQAEVSACYMRVRDIKGYIVRVAATDCLAFGDANEEVEFLVRHGFEVQVLPGVLPETVFACRVATRVASDPHGTPSGRV